MTDLNTRYGQPRQRPRWFWPAIAAVGIAIGVAFAAWVAFQDRPVTAHVWGYDVVSDNQITLTLDVKRPEPLEVTCSVYAQAADHSIVGEASVTLPAIDDEDLRTTIDITTERRAVTGVIRTCEPTG